MKVMRPKLRTPGGAVHENQNGLLSVPIENLLEEVLLIVVHEARRSVRRKCLHHILGQSVFPNSVSHTVADGASETGVYRHAC
jgi:hypothetical protein